MISDLDEEYYRRRFAGGRGGYKYVGRGLRVFLLTLVFFSCIIASLHIIWSHGQTKIYALLKMGTIDFLSLLLPYRLLPGIS